MPDGDPRDVDSALAELARAVEALRVRLAVPDAGASGEASPDASPSERSERDALAGVREILAIPASGIQPAELFTLVADRISRLLAADRVMLFVAQHGRLVPRSARGFRRDDLDAIVIEPGVGLVGRVFKEDRVLCHESAPDGDDDAFIERFPVTTGVAPVHFFFEQLHQLRPPFLAPRFRVGDFRAIGAGEVDGDRHPHSSFASTRHRSIAVSLDMLSAPAR